MHVFVCTCVSVYIIFCCSHSITIQYMTVCSMYVSCWCLLFSVHRLECKHTYTYTRTHRQTNRSQWSFNSDHHDVLWSVYVGVPCRYNVKRSKSHVSKPKNWTVKIKIQKKNWKYNIKTIQLNFICVEVLNDSFLLFLFLSNIDCISFILMVIHSKQRCLCKSK